MKRFIQIAMFLLIILLSGCSTSPEKVNDNHDVDKQLLFEGKVIDINSNTIQLETISHNSLNLENEVHSQLVKNLVSEIVERIDNKYGAPYFKVYGSYNYWSLEINDGDFDMKVTFFSLNKENTQNYIAVEFWKDSDMVDELVYQFKSESLNTLNSFLEDNN